MNQKEPKKRPALWKLLLEQLLLLVLVLCVFALFHHVLPDWRTRSQGSLEPVGRVETNMAPETEAPSAAPTALPEETAQPAETEEPEEPQPTEEPAEQIDPDSWSYRFSEHFSETAFQDETHYCSPTLSVTVTEYAHTEKYPRLTYYVADCYLTDVSSFRVGFPQEETYGLGETIAAQNGAILAVNGDSMLIQRTGLLIRNGDIYGDVPNNGDLCVLYPDGTMETYFPGTYTAEEILAKAPLHAWQFGPALLDENGQPLQDFNISRELQEYHPRTAMGYYEPGHYCFVVVDGRDPTHSDGAQMYTLAQIMADLGCKRAYNLDGGASSMMILNGVTVNSPAKTGLKNDKDRLINDMVILVEAEEGEGRP